MARNKLESWSQATETTTGTQGTAGAKSVIVSFPHGFLRRHLVCHFYFYDGPVTGLAVIDGRHWYVKRIGDINCGRFRLTPIEEQAGKSQ